jgi:hypothetical protein
MKVDRADLGDPGPAAERLPGDHIPRQPRQATRRSRASPRPAQRQPHPQKNCSAPTRTRNARNPRGKARDNT